MRLNPQRTRDRQQSLLVTTLEKLMQIALPAFPWSQPNHIPVVLTSVMVLSYRMIEQPT
ncbi:hypothetical protein ACQP06_28280 [Nocardia sp. CA-136227]|uniref:hypothetical protein n=1 Tax=Nocardia sp. CA-136227 TaxID=3239979 RepID=UPI003D988FF7